MEILRRHKKNFHTNTKSTVNGHHTLSILYLYFIYTLPVLICTVFVPETYILQTDILHALVYTYIKLPHVNKFKYSCCSCLFYSSRSFLVILLFFSSLLLLPFICSSHSFVQVIHLFKVFSGRCSHRSSHCYMVFSLFVLVILPLALVILPLALVIPLVTCFSHMFA